ncbi:GntR family transcriptional regulator [Caballeronia glebae]|uniref:GntR family transcriptional regulator n=1 Tax=Caballeronia glebae TaxID=1777143 RepID=A0A158B296_9BURK|nr:GntR family transcriptional regulator [Caballeronia glebae]
MERRYARDSRSIVRSGSAIVLSSLRLTPVSLRTRADDAAERDHRDVPLAQRRARLELRENLLRANIGRLKARLNRNRATHRAEAVRTTSWMPAPLSMLIATVWIEDGTAQHIMNAQIADIRADDFAANAKARGVVVMPSSAFAVDRSEIEHGVRINLACAESRDQLVSGLRMLAGTLKDRPRALFGHL